MRCTKTSTSLGTHETIPAQDNSVRNAMNPPGAVKKTPFFPTTTIKMARYAKSATGPQKKVPMTCQQQNNRIVQRASNLRKLLQKEMREIVRVRNEGTRGIAVDDDAPAIKYRQRMRADTRCARFLYHGNIWTPLWRSSPNK